MKKSIIISLALVAFLIPVNVIATDCQNFYNDPVVTLQSPISGYSAIGIDLYKPNQFYVPNIQNYDRIAMYQFLAMKPYTISGNTGKEEAVIVKSGTNEIAHGVIGFLDNGASYTIYMVFTDWDAKQYGLTGNQALTLDYANTVLSLNFGHTGAINQGNDLGYPYIRYGDPTYPSRPAMGVAGCYDLIQYYSIFDQDLCWEETGNGTTHLELTKNGYNSRFAVYTNGTAWYNGTGTTDLEFTVFGCDLMTYIWSGDGVYFNFKDISPATCGEPAEPTPTLPTPTPTPVPAVCGYWTFAVNTSNIARNDYVQGTLTENDPANLHKMIEWYRVLPSGQEVLKKQFVYDSGFFGFGASWVEIDTISGSASASSEAAAKQNSLQFLESGTCYMRAKIYEDKSLLPAVFHDYNLLCTLNQIVYVAYTTQGTSQLAVNVYEADTNALISGVEVHAFDYFSGEWYNKTAAYGGTIYFDVVPGHNHRFLVDDSRWITYDEDYVIPNPPGSYPIYLKRPLPSIVNHSYAQFYVKDGSTYNSIYGATISLSDGQVKNTLPSGFAEFSVDNGADYYYTISKSGYNGQTGSFNINVDTTINELLYPKIPTATPTTLPYWTVQPTPLQTYPNGTVIPGQTVAPQPTFTLDTVGRATKLTDATDVWYRNAPFLSNFLFLLVIMGGLGLMTKSMGGNRRRGRR